MSDAKFDDFVAELKALCRKHGVTLAVSAYDGLDVWPFDESLGEIYAAGIENHLSDSDR